MTFKTKPRRKIKAYPTLWAVVIFHGKGLDSYWATKGDADREAAVIGPNAFVLPPIAAWGGADQVRPR